MSTVEFPWYWRDRLIPPIRTVYRRSVLKGDIVRMAHWRVMKLTLDLNGRQLDPVGHWLAALRLRDTGGMHMCGVAADGALIGKREQFGPWPLEQDPTRWLNNVIDRWRDGYTLKLRDGTVCATFPPLVRLFVQRPWGPQLAGDEIEL